MQIRLKLELSVNSTLAEVMYQSIKPEIDDMPSERAKVALRLKGNKLTVDIRSKDLIALRASLNAVVQLIYVTQSVYRL